MRLIFGGTPEFSYGDQVHLAPVAAVGGIDDDYGTVGTVTRMRTAAPFPTVFRRLVEMPQRDLAAGLDVIQVRGLRVRNSRREISLRSAGNHVLRKLNDNQTRVCALATICLNSAACSARALTRSIGSPRASSSIQPS